MKKRLLFYEIIKHLEHKNALVITGMRQVGKTTLMRQIFEELREKPKLWFDLDNPLDQKGFEDIDYANIYRRLQEAAGVRKERIFVFIDEIQNYPEITRVIKYLIDHFKVKFIVTGSSNFYLRNLFPESLSGRKFLYQLPPLTFIESLYFQDVISLPEARNCSLNKVLSGLSLADFKKREVFYNSYLLYGGFPEVVVTQDSTTKQMVLKNILTSFFEKDIKILSDYSDIRELRDLILLLVPRVGSTIDVARLASELGVDRGKIYRYLEFLQGVFTIKLLPRFSRSIDRAVAGGKKVYFADTGLLNVLGKVNEGQLLENVVINQLFSYGDLSFYSRRGRTEIDAVLNGGIAFEIKLTGTEADRQKLANLSAKMGLRSYFVISKNFVEKEGFLPASAI